MALSLSPRATIHRHLSEQALVLLLVACLAGLTLADTPSQPPQRQVTLFGITASSTDKGVDPKLAQISYQLRKLKPGHGFQLRAVLSKSLQIDESLTCDLGDGLSAIATLRPSQDDPAKVRIAFRLEQDGKPIYKTAVTTPPNQLFFCEKPLPDGTRLLIGIGAR